jgi:hypothetical protein
VVWQGSANRGSQYPTGEVSCPRWVGHDIPLGRAAPSFHLRRVSVLRGVQVGFEPERKGFERAAPAVHHVRLRATEGS